MESKEQIWEKLRDAYKKSITLPFCDKVNAYMMCLHWNSSIFKDKTGLAKDAYRRIYRNDKNYKNPEKDTVMAICVGLGLDYRLAVDLLQSVEHALSPFSNKVDEAYEYILLELHGQPLEVCNQELIRRGIDPLGAKEYKPDKIGKIAIL